MSVLLVGISHNSAPVSVLERVALDSEGVHKLLTDAAACDFVNEAAVVSTCNRVEVYAEVDRFHGSVESLSRLLVERAGETAESMLPHLYVHYDDGAVSHLFQVASGLDSMAVGEGQILGQTSEALRVGKRSRAETGIDRVAPTLVSAALERSDEAVGSVQGSYVVVVGAGAMAGLATATVTRLGAGHVSVVNRTPDRARRLAAEYSAHPVALVDLAAELERADVVITCTGATGVLVTRDMVATARAGNERPLAVIDLALPHDVEPSVAELPGVTLIGLARLADDLHGSDAAREVLDVRRIVGEEVTAFLAARRQASVTPTVVALRSMATAVVDSEMARLESRLPRLDDAARAEIRHTVRRVADKLLHEPTVRVKELVNEQGAVSYERALAELFALDPESVDAVTRPDVSGATRPSSALGGPDPDEGAAP